MECDSTIEQFGGRTNIERWIPQLTTDVLFCADANLNDKTGVCYGDSGGPAIRRFDTIIVRKYVDGKVRYVLVGTVTGNVNSCQQGGLPDIYNFIGNKKVINLCLTKHAIDMDKPDKLLN